jgi:peptidoglycan-associated lipoprotein
MLEQPDPEGAMNDTMPHVMMTMTRARTLAVALVCLGLAAPFAAGCGPDAEPAPKTAAQAQPSAAPATSATVTAPSAKADVTSPNSGSIHIDDKITKACGDIPSAHFAFDSTAIGGDAMAALDALARCFVAGPLKGRSLRLTGHADPRGETEYNLALGQKRAGSVADYLFTKGLDKTHAQTLSKGAFEATGTDEAGWARDRKVLVQLVE